MEAKNNSADESIICIVSEFFDKVSFSTIHQMAMIELYDANVLRAGSVGRWLNKRLDSVKIYRRACHKSFC